MNFFFFFPNGFSFHKSTFILLKLFCFFSRGGGAIIFCWLKFFFFPKFILVLKFFSKSPKFSFRANSFHFTQIFFFCFLFSLRGGVSSGPTRPRGFSPKNFPAQNRILVLRALLIFWAHGKGNRTLFFFWNFSLSHFLPLQIITPRYTTISFFIVNFALWNPNQKGLG